MEWTTHSSLDSTHYLVLSTQRWINCFQESVTTTSKSVEWLLKVGIKEEDPQSNNVVFTFLSSSFLDRILKLYIIFIIYQSFLHFTCAFIGQKGEWWRDDNWVACLFISIIRSTIRNGPSRHSRSPGRLDACCCSAATCHGIMKYLLIEHSKLRNNRV